MIRFVLSVISVNLYNDQTRCFVDRMGKYFSSLLGELHRYSGNALEAIVSRLRRKINLAYPGAAVVKAAPGIGYVLSNDVV
ncbi:hypothetical protein AB6Q56_20960 [Dechloromonas sp. ARDL1]|uniref:hypothetical protein n=1 Tax=Dechloromonas sp. ARDL1 TaxID=3322121 RepID=UPI003DA7353F